MSTEKFFNVRGPSRTGSSKDALWTASIYFKQNQDPAQQWAMQELFVGPGGGDLLAPGTMFGYCRVQSLRVNIGDCQFRFDRIDATTFELPILLQTDPTAWDDGFDPSDQVPECLCLAGEIPVSALQPNDSNPDWTAQFAGIIDSPGDLTVTSSGLWISGQAHLPWDQAALVNPAHFHVMVPLPNGGSGDPNLVVQLDRETQTQASADEFAASFNHLNAALATGGNWSRLELSNPTTIPSFFWMLTPSVSGSAPTNQFQLGPGEMSLLLFGGEPGTGGTPQTFATASVNPVFTRAADGTLSVHVTAGDRTSPAKAVYTGSPTTESIELQNVKAGYDALTAATLLRQQIGLSDPLVNPDPAALWGCVVLEDGWAQLPFLNVSESIYASAFPPPDVASPVPAVILAGAAEYGNDNQPPASEQTWTVIITSGAGLDGTWTLKLTAGKLTVTGATATLFDPGLELNGFLWLGNEPPTAADALPSLSNWLAAVTMIPLRSTNPNDLIPSPWDLTFSSLKFARQPDPFAPVLGNWSFSVQASPAWDTLIATGFFPTLADELKNRPLVWRRHPHLPAVQSLPLTQSLNPPNYPSPSRQFAPFQLGLTGGKSIRTIVLVDQPGGGFPPQFVTLSDAN